MLLTGRHHQRECKLSCRKVNLWSVAGDKLGRRLLHIRPVIEKRLSTVTKPA